MSRCYRFEGLIIGASKDFLTDVLKEQISQEITVSEYKNKFFLVYGDTRLCGGESELEAHDRVSNIIKAKFPGAAVKTRWAYLEDIPFEEYGDEVEE